MNLEKQAAVGHNVLAMLRAGTPDRVGEAVVIGAHYDHLGSPRRAALRHWAATAAPAYLKFW